MLEAIHLVKRFSGVAVVNDVSFEVRAGEVVGYPGAERLGEDHDGAPAQRTVGTLGWT